MIGQRRSCIAISGRAPSFPKAPFIVSMAISRILSPEFRDDDHSSHPSRTRDECPANFYSPWCDDTRGLNRAGCPSSVLSCTAWGFSCLANCSASGELLPRLFTLACTLLPKNRRCVFCDTFHRRSFSTATPAYFTRHAAVWCSDFPPAKSRQRGTHQRSSAIEGKYITIRNAGKQEGVRIHVTIPDQLFLSSCFPD